MPPPQACRKLVIKRGSPMRTITALFVGLAATLLSLGVCLYVTLRHDFMPSHFVHGELDVQTIGHALMSSGKYGYILPFEVISLLLLACIVGGILIARKR